jgi:hypothetical protein
MRKQKYLPNPQNVPAYCGGQTQVPLTHGLLNDKNMYRISGI